MPSLIPDGVPTKFQNFLYLLCEMETAVERGDIVWPEEGRIAACQRLVLIGFCQRSRH